MYSKKFRLTTIIRNGESVADKPIHFAGTIHAVILGKVCYLGFFKIGERGWFLCDEMQGFSPVHRIHTSEVKDVKYEENGRVIVITENTTYIFDVEE